MIDSRAEACRLVQIEWNSDENLCMFSGLVAQGGTKVVVSMGSGLKTFVNGVRDFRILQIHWTNNCGYILIDCEVKMLQDSLGSTLCE